MTKELKIKTYEIFKLTITDKDGSAMASRHFYFDSYSKMSFKRIPDTALGTIHADLQPIEVELIEGSLKESAGQDDIKKDYFKK